MALIAVNSVTINALNPDALATFWAGVTGGTVRDAGNGFVLVEPSGDGVGCSSNRLRNPVLTDRATAEKEICQRGGRTIEHRCDSTGAWFVMADPEGNPFCI